jgi:hypothetical protein
VEHYRISDGFNPSDAFIRVTPDPDAANLPPVAPPIDVKPAEVQGLTEATVDVATKAFDPDDAETPLQFSLPANQNATINGGTVVVGLADRSQTVLYRVTDADGASAVGVIRVPGIENHPPVLSENGRDPQNRVIEAGSTAPLTILLDVITEDPDGDPDIRLTDSEVVLNGVGDLTRLDDGTGFVFTPPAELSESATVTIDFEVTDRPERTPGRAPAPRLPLRDPVAGAGDHPGQLAALRGGPGSGAGASTAKSRSTYDLAPLTRDDQDDPLTYQLDTSTFRGLEVEQNGSVVTIVSRLAEAIRRSPSAPRSPSGTRSRRHVRAGVERVRGDRGGHQQGTARGGVVLAHRGRAQRPHLHSELRQRSVEPVRRRRSSRSRCSTRPRRVGRG